MAHDLSPFTPTCEVVMAVIPLLNHMEYLNSMLSQLLSSHLWTSTTQSRIRLSGNTKFDVVVISLLYIYNSHGSYLILRCQYLHITVYNIRVYDINHNHYRDI